jgi:hypothetical protein
MTGKVALSDILEHIDQSDRPKYFAMLILGMTDVLQIGQFTPMGFVHSFFTADNCIYVRENLGEVADEIVGRAIQLPDLFDALEPDQARSEYLKELSCIRKLCEGLFDRETVVAA